jgi:transcriptional regulator with XRE-family HTH domain
VVDLGALLRAARDEAGLTQVEVARRAGVTANALSRWESGARPVRSDDADRVLAACGRDVRFSLVLRHADTDGLLERMATVPVLERYSQFDLVLPHLLVELQATGAVRFSRGWAAAALGLPALRRCGGFELSSDPADQAAVAGVLRPWHPDILDGGRRWEAHWDEAVFQRDPSATWSATVLGSFHVEVVDLVGPEHRVQVGDQAWRVVEPTRLVPDDVDETTLDRWRRLAT